MDKIMFHIDVNSAYLSWSAVNKLKNEPDSVDLRTICSIIGGNRQNRHGIVLAKSIPAKKYNIQTAEPIVSALKKCPFLVIEPPNHSMYEEYSQKLMSLLREYTPDIEKISIDECFLDFTPISHNYYSPIEAANIIKNRIYDDLGFTVNIGISSNKILAKMASDFKKPNLVHTLFPNEIQEKMWPLAVSELYMAGKSSVETFHKLGINTIGDLANTPPDIICLHLKSHGKLLWEYANGIDNSKLISEQTQLKGIGNSTTLSRDIEDPDEAKHVLLSLSETVAKRLRSANQLARMESVEIKYNDFISASHQMQLLTPVNTTDQIHKNACLLFDQLWSGKPIRLLGIRTSKLIKEDEPVQLSLFDTQIDEKQLKAEKAMDEIKKKFGNKAVMRGSLLDEKEP